MSIYRATEYGRIFQYIVTWAQKGPEQTVQMNIFCAFVVGVWDHKGPFLRLQLVLYYGILSE